MIGLESVGRYLTRALLSVVLVVLNLTFTVAATIAILMLGMHEKD